MEFVIREALIGGVLFAAMILCLAGIITIIHKLFNQNE